MSDDEDLPPEPENQEGRRKDSESYVEGNTREDGSYKVGKGRPPEQSRFRAGDGRPRGRRPKGTKNLLTDWREELSELVQSLSVRAMKRLTTRQVLTSRGR